MNFNSILIGSDDAKRLADFYTKLFGEPIYNEGGYVSWQIGTGGMTVGPHDQVHGKNAQPGRMIWNIESDDVQGDFDRLKAAGATVVREPYKFEAPDMPIAAPEMWIATLSDPDDNYFQLATPFQM